MPGLKVQTNFATYKLNEIFFFKIQGGVPNNAFSECCWSHSALAQSQVTGTPWGDFLRKGPFVTV